MKTQTRLWLGLAGSAVVLLVLLVIAFSGGRRTPPPKPKRPATEKKVRPMRRDWYQVGFDRGLDWKKRVRNRRMRYTRAEATQTAELMTSDYANKGIRKEGEKAFVRGFVKAVFGE